MRDGEFYDILKELDRAYDISEKYLNLVLEHAMEDEYWFSKVVFEGTKKKLLNLLNIEVKKSTQE